MILARSKSGMQSRKIEAVCGRPEPEVLPSAYRIICREEDDWQDKMQVEGASTSSDFIQM